MKINKLCVFLTACFVVVFNTYGYAAPVSSSVDTEYYFQLGELPKLKASCSLNKITQLDEYGKATTYINIDDTKKCFTNKLIKNATYKWSKIIIDNLYDQNTIPERTRAQASHNYLVLNQIGDDLYDLILKVLIDNHKAELTKIFKYFTEEDVINILSDISKVIVRQYIEKVQWD